MSLGLFLWSELPGDVWTEDEPPAEAIDELFSGIEAAAAAALERRPYPLLDWLYARRPFPDVLELELCPFADHLGFVIADGALNVSLSTTAAGPGYHAHVVGLLDEIAARLGLTWEERELGDETGHFPQRDFGQLQRQMAEWLRTLAERTMELSAGSGVALMLPTDFYPKSQAFVVSPLKSWTREWFERLAKAKGEELLALAAELFPWWDEGCTKDNLRNFGLTLCHSVLTWTHARSAEEQIAMDTALGCFRRAGWWRRRRIPKGIWKELKQLIAAKEMDVFPRPEGFGLRRRFGRRPLTAGWTVEVPGFFREFTTEDESGSGYEFQDRAVVARCGFPVGDETDTSLGLAGGQELELSAKGHVGRYVRDVQEHHFFLLAVVRVRDWMCELQVLYPDEAGHDWALRIARSLRNDIPSELRDYIRMDNEESEG